MEACAVTSLLGLDTAKAVGWSFFRSADDPAPVCQTWIAPVRWDSDDYSPFFLAFEEWLKGTISVFKPDMVAWESPVIVPRGGWGEGRGSDENNIRRLIGVVTVAELVCAHLGVPTREVHNSTCKSFMGVSPRKDKDAMVAAVTQLGYSVGDHNQADSVAVALCVYSDLGEA